MSPIFGSIKSEFATAFSNVRKAINGTPPPLDKLKQFLNDGYSQLKPQLVHCNSIDDVLDVVNDHCTLINISCLEGIVEQFKIKEAEIHIQNYKDIVRSFIEEIKPSLGLEIFKLTKTFFKYETPVFVLDWDPTKCTLEDVKDILKELLEKNVEIIKRY